MGIGGDGDVSAPLHPVDKIVSIVWNVVKCGQGSTMSVKKKEKLMRIRPNLPNYSKRYDEGK